MSQSLAQASCRSEEQRTISFWLLPHGTRNHTQLQLVHSTQHQANSLTYPLLLLQRGVFRKMAARDAPPEREQQLPPPPPPLRTVHIANLSRNVRSAHLKEICGA